MDYLFFCFLLLDGRINFNSFLPLGDIINLSQFLPLEGGG
jgi:hypothetical protein